MDQSPLHLLTKKNPLRKEKAAPPKDAPSKPGGNEPDEGGGTKSSKAARALAQKTKRAICWLYALTPLWAPYLGVRVTGMPIVDLYAKHTTFILVTLIPLIAVVYHQYRSQTRVNPPKRKNRPRPAPQPPLRPSHGIAVDTADIALFLDKPIQRLILAALYVAALAAPLKLPVGVDDWTALKDTASASENLRPILFSAAAPLAYFAYLRFHVGSIISDRQFAVEAVHQIARDYLRYPKKLPMRATRQELQLSSPLTAVNVTKWRSLTEIDSAFVMTPSDLSVQEEKPWDEFGANLNERLPRKEEWRVRRDTKGRGATIEAANYPTAVLWDGEYDPDPLTFRLGVNLDTGDLKEITLNEASPHILFTGATSSGKTSGAEIMAAQVLVTPMPWDPELYGQVHFIDPKGPLARRWRGRRGVVTSEGILDHYFERDEETGQPLDGIEVMMLHLEAIDAERLRRDKILAKYPQAATWIHLPDEVKRKERLAPILVILDEYLDHVEKINGSSALVARQNAARGKLTELTGLHARKYRNVGMHTATIAQEAKMTDIGSSFVRNLPARVVTGEMDEHQLRSMFGDREIPSLPSTRRVDGKTKTVPGRARIMNARGQEITRTQIMWFGGRYNDETLDKWLPRGEEPPNGDFTPAEGGTIGQPAPEEHPLPDDLSMVDLDGNGEPDGVTVRPDPASAEGEGLSAEELYLREQNAKATPPEPQVGTFDPSAFDWQEQASSEPHDPMLDQNPPEGQDAPTADPDPSGESPVEAPQNEQVTKEVDPSATFPAAATTAPMCGEEGCANDATRKCALRGEPRCDEHLYEPVEPGNKVCSACYWAHPVADADLAPYYRALLEQQALTPGVDLTWEKADDGRVAITASRVGGRKIIRIVGATGTEPSAQSHAGKVEGSEAVMDRITDTFAATRQEKK